MESYQSLVAQCAATIAAQLVATKQAPAERDLATVARYSVRLAALVVNEAMGLEGPA